MPHRPTGYLVDNSAYNRGRKAIVAERLRPLMERGLLYTCAAIELEAGRALAAASYDRALEMRREALISLYMPDHIWERSMEVQRALAARGTNQGPGVVDIAIAVCADHHGFTVLHYDADFDAIQDATGIPCEWVAQPGTADGADDL